MPQRRSSRQARLGTGSSTAREAARWANHRVLKRSFLSATALATFSWCPVKPFIERVLAHLGLDRVTPAMIEGAAAHEAVQGAVEALSEPSTLTFPQALSQRTFLLATEVPLKDERAMLRGIVDLAVAQDGTATMVELKNTRAPQGSDPSWGVPAWESHVVQAMVYGQLARVAWGIVPRLAISYLRDGSKARVLSAVAQNPDAQSAVEQLIDDSVVFDPSPGHFARLRTLIHEFRRTERAAGLPEPVHGRPDRCSGCPVRRWCPRRLDDPGAWERLDATLLDR